MRAAIRTSLRIFLLLICFYGIVPDQALASNSGRTKGGLIVKLRPGARSDAFFRRYGIRSGARLWNSSTYRIRIPHFYTRDHLLTDLAFDPEVERIGTEKYSYQLSP